MIFITGYPRSGTTLISNKIGEFEGLFIGPESNYYRKFYNKLAFNNSTFVSNAISDKRLADFGLDIQETKSCCESAQYDKTKFLKVFLEKCAEKSSDRGSTILEKSPAHILYHRKILTHYPESKFIFITRDPRDVINSNLNVDWIHSNITKHAVSYKLYFESYLELKREFTDRVKLIKYEDFLLSDKDILDSTIDFISPNKKLSKSVRSSETVPEWEMSWKSESLKPVNSAKLYSWKRKPNMEIEKVVQFILRDHLSAMGYEKTNHYIALKDRINYHLYDNIIYRNILLFRRHFFS